MYDSFIRIRNAPTPDGRLGETWIVNDQVLRPGRPQAEVLAAAVSDLNALKRVAQECSAPSTQALGRQLIRQAETLLEKIRNVTPETVSQIDSHAADIGAMPRKLTVALKRDQQQWESLKRLADDNPFAGDSAEHASYGELLSRLTEKWGGASADERARFLTRARAAYARGAGTGGDGAVRGGVDSSSNND